jgi:hypothetical protein
MTRTRNPKMKCGIVALARRMAVLTVLVACAQGQQVDVANLRAVRRHDYSHGYLSGRLQHCSNSTTWTHVS